MRARFWSVCFLAGLLASGRPPLCAQIEPGVITGYVRIRGGMVVPQGTVVMLEGEGGGFLEQVTPSGNGQFSFSSLRKGIYYVKAKAPGYREAIQRVELLTLSRLTVHLTLVPAQQEGSAPPPPPAQVVQARQLQIPEKARKEFERGARELMQNKKPKQALPHLQKAAEIYPEYYEAYELMGTAYMDLQEWPEAEQALKRSVEISDQYAPSLIALGALYNRQGRFADALPWLEKAEKLDPDSWLCHLELAQSLLPQERIAEAETHARLAHTMNPQFPLVHLALANVSLAKGELAAGREECQHFLKLVPEGQLAEMVKAKTREIDALLEEQKVPKP